jgi:8-oxo-dGTP pyrophosphatase MutT (NUDIX family)
MPISSYIRGLRAKIGTARILLPSVSAHIFDPADRLLLVRQRESGIWSTPGGAIDPDERPADAIVRETWEETGLLVAPERLSGIYGGPECVVRYPNGDEVQYVVAAFECSVVRGTLRHESDETQDARYVARSEAEKLQLSPWFQSVLTNVYARREPFAPPRWSPPASRA